MFLFFAVLFFIAYYYFYYNPSIISNGLIELKYDDLYHYTRKEKGYVVYLLTFDFIPKNIDKIFIEKVKTIVEEFKVCKLEKTIFNNKLKYSDQDINTLIKQLTLNGYIPENNFELIIKTYQSKHLISFILDKKEKQLKICFNHGVFDGIKFVELALFFSNNTRIQKFNFPKNSFLKTLYCLGKLFLNISILSKKGGLIKDTDNGVIYSFIIKKKEIDRIREKYNVSFMGAYQSIILEKISGYSDKLLIGTATAISNPFQFNSVGGIPYYIDLSKKEEILSKKIDTKLKKNSYLLMVTTNELIKKIFKSKKNNIDILFSSIPISKNDIFMGGSIINGFDTYMPNHNSPVYVFSGKVGENVYVSMGVKNKGLISYLKKYEWKEI